MANSIGNLSATVLAQETAQQIESKFPALSRFCVNYTENIPSAFGYGSTLCVKNLTNPTVTKWNANAPGFLATTASSADINIVVNQYAAAKVGFDDTQLSSPVGGMYVQKFGERTSYAISKQIITDVIANVSSSNFSQSQSFASSSGYGRTAINSSTTILDNAGVTDNDRLIVLNPNYYGNGLLADSSLYAPLNFQINSDVGETGQFLKVLNFQVAKSDSSTFPTTFDGTNKLVGFACHPSALAFVTVAPPDPRDFVMSGATVMDFGVAVSPRSGIQVVVAKYYLPNASTMYVETRVMYGSTAGVAGALSAYVSPSAV